MCLLGNGGCCGSEASLYLRARLKMKQSSEHLLIDKLVTYLNTWEGKVRSTGLPMLSSWRLYLSSAVGPSQAALALSALDILMPARGCKNFFCLRHSLAARLDYAFVWHAGSQPCRAFPFLAGSLATLALSTLCLSESLPSSALLSVLTIPAPAESGQEIE